MHLKAGYELLISPTGNSSSHSNIYEKWKNELFDTSLTYETRYMLKVVSNEELHQLSHPRINAIFFQAF